MQLDEPHKWSVNNESLLGVVQSQRVRRLAEWQGSVPHPARRLACGLREAVNI